MLVRPREDATPIPDAGRYPALDGLRGIAAAVVVANHAMMVSPEVARTWRDGGADGWVWWMVFTPARLAWAGAEAVFVFFVMSGFVLALPFLRARHPSWRAYYPSRLVRLYVPTTAALGLAVVSFLAVDHAARPGMSWWLAEHDIALSVGAVVHDALLLDGVGWIDSVLWSLRWEVAFSLLLPLALLAAVRAGRWRPALAAGTIMIIALVGATGAPSVGYLGMFEVGVLMAAERDRLHALAGRIRSAGWAALAAAGGALLLADWWPATGRPMVGVGPSVSTLGAALLVFLFLGCPTAIAVGRTGIVQWLGKRSFSLYLVHEPIVVTTALLLRTTSPALVLAVAGPISLAAAAAFYQVVEGPSHRTAKRIGRLADRRSVSAR